MTKLFFTEEQINSVRDQLIEYLMRNRISPSSLAVLIGIEPQTLTAFLKKTKKPQVMKIFAMKKWLEEYDLVDFRRK